jgi:5-methyltetrahydropteroyltriglutamate--homocysteine methyltransferase
MGKPVPMDMIIKVSLNSIQSRFVRMSTLVDDVGSFPLSRQTDPKSFEKAYVLAREAIVSGKDIRKDSLLLNDFHRVIMDSFKKKLETGLDVVNYPQHFDMHRQFLDVIHEAMNKGTYLVDERRAIIPEVHVINEEARRIYDEYGKKVLLRVCVTGPLELYLKEVGTTLHKDVLMMFAETVNRFAKNSILDSEYVKTEVVSLDEPSLGFQDLSSDRETILDALEKALDLTKVTKQIHLHSPARVPDLLEVKNLDVLSFEYAASSRNIESVSRKVLEKAGKRIRVGISRTDVDSIMAELYERGITKPYSEQLVESEEAIRRRFMIVEEKYGDTMMFVGPDCGLGGWPTQEAAQLLLRRTVSAVRCTRLASESSNVC